MSTLSKRGQGCCRPFPEYLQLSFEAWKDEFHPDSNPNGFINLSVAENLLSLPDVAAALSNAPPIPASRLTYGTPDHFNAATARFLGKYITRTSVAAEHIVVLNGGTSVIETLSTVLCDPGDVVITTGPGYRGFELHVKGRADALLSIARLDEAADGGHPVVSVQALEDAWQREGGDESRVRMVIICSPNNPTGEILTKEKILEIVRWGREKGVHLVFDEIYAQSIYADGARFWSVAEVLDGELGSDIHIVWSFSKDMCLGGVRIGVLYSQNTELLQSINGFLAFFSGTSRHTQWCLESILANDNWLDKYFMANKKRLQDTYSMLVSHLRTLDIPFMPADAGFFIWLDLRKWMRGNSTDDEMALWHEILRGKVLLTPSSQCYGSRYGYYRLCFAAVDNEALKLGIERMAQILVEIEDSKKQ